MSCSISRLVRSTTSAVVVLRGCSREAPPSARTELKLIASMLCPLSNTTARAVPLNYTPPCGILAIAVEDATVPLNQERHLAPNW